MHRNKFFGIRKNYVYYGQFMQNNFIETNVVFMKHIYSKFGQSAKASLLKETLVVTEVETVKLPKFKIIEEQIEHIEKLEFWEQEEDQNTKDDY